MSISVRPRPPEQTRLSIWQPASRPVLIYDPAYSPPKPPRLDARFADLLRRTPVIWLGALTLGVAVGGGLAVTNPLAYSATALMLGAGSDEARAQEERVIIRSDEVMRGVVDRLGIARVAPDCGGAGEGRALCAARVVKGQMQARIVNDPNGIEAGPMIRLTATHADPIIAVGMLDAAIAIDRKIWQAAHLTGRADVLDPQLAASQSALDATAAEIARIRADARVTNIAQDLAQAAAESTALLRQDGELRLRQAAASAELNAAQNAVRIAPETVLDSREVSAGDPGQDSQAMLLQLKLQRAHMSQLYAHDYPGLAELDHKIEAVETAMQTQSKSTKSVIRDVRNPVLAVLGTKVASLGAESAGLVQQRQELQRQLGAAATRESALRDAQRRLAALQQRQGVQEAAVRQLTLSVADLRAQDALFGDHLAQHRFLQRPEAVVIPWTGLRGAAIIGSATGLIVGFALQLLAWRRRTRHRVEPVSRQALERLVSAETAPVARAVPQIMAVPLPPAFGAPKAQAARPKFVPTDGALADILDHAASMRMFALRRERDIRSLGFDGQGAGVPAKADE